MGGGDSMGGGGMFGGGASTSYGTTSGGMEVFGPEFGQLNQPSWYQNPSFYQGLGSGLQQMGSSIGGGPQQNFDTTIPTLATPQFPQQQAPAGLIPVPQQQQPDIVAALLRLLQGIQ